ncbi:FAD:protein FMN transferase [candidate division WWE3 bacterium]|uniref:FAD:protein FMN transferase n=1 Tax=candidate division WWE3 bacterium TaxID=2053526 RepID=A0A955LLB0_UNCKA|nr:FAD:protein FMN transferase [candidate division WWE3 bacterium]
MTYTFPATGTIWCIEFLEKLPIEKFTQIKKEIDAQIKRDDAIYSRFNTQSELSNLNKNKRLDNPSRQLYDALALAEDIRLMTKDAFTPFIGTYLHQLGYDATNRFAVEGELTKDNSKLGRFLKLDSEVIALPNEAHVDVSSFAKGIMIDNVVSLLKTLHLNEFVVNAGGDIFVSTQNKPVEIAIEAPTHLADVVETVSLKNQAIATSANTKRVWIDQKTEEERSHIKTYNSDIKQVSVIAENAKTADLLSTVIFISGDSFSKPLHSRFNFEERIYQS